MIDFRSLVRGNPQAEARLRNPRPAKPVIPSHKLELWYSSRLLALVAQLRAETRSTVLPYLKRIAPQYEPAEIGQIHPDLDKSGQIRTADAAASQQQVNAEIDRAARKFGGIGTTAQRLADIAAQQALEGVDDQLIASVRQAIGVDVGMLLVNSPVIQAALTAATTANVALIKSIPDQYFDKLEQLIAENTAQGIRFDTLADKIEHLADVTESRARLIARDQTSKMNGAFNEVRQTSIGISKYTWQTAGDERVRPTHAENDGKVFSWDDPPAETGNPGDDINCRCVAIPVFDLDDDEEGDDVADDED